MTLPHFNSLEEKLIRMKCVLTRIEHDFLGAFFSVPNISFPMGTYECILLQFACVRTKFLLTMQLHLSHRPPPVPTSTKHARTCMQIIIFCQISSAFTGLFFCHCQVSLTYIFNAVQNYTVEWHHRCCRRRRSSQVYHKYNIHIYTHFVNPPRCVMQTFIL